MRWLAAALALLLAVPAAAQDKPEWVGVWDGRVGTYPVRLCMDVDGTGVGRGSYYYLSTLEPISLREDGEEGGWTESAPAGDGEALWEFTERTGQRLRGTWRQGRRSLPFSLTPLNWTENEWGGPCGADAFLLPRVGAGEVDSEAADLKGWRFTRQTWLPPAHFAPEVSITGFAFPNERPGDPTINAVLAAYLPRGRVEDEFLQCHAGSIWSLGYDGDFEQYVQPAMVSGAFLMAMESYSYFCGGAHPSHGYFYRTFDRAGGGEVDLVSWLNGASIRHETYDDPESEGVDLVQPALRELILSHDPSDDLPLFEEFEDEPYGPDCLELAREEEFWSFGLSHSGMLFIPSMPHVATPCVATFTVPWAELAPFLSDEGRAGLARLREP